VDELAKLWATLTEYIRKAIEYATQELTKLWSIIVEYLNILVERVYALPVERLRPIAALICSALLVALILWISALRKLRRARRELTEAEARCEVLQAQYDAEVKWRTAAERVEAARPPVSPPQAAPQPTGPAMPKVAAPASPVRITTTPLMLHHPGAAGRAEGPTHSDQDKAR
jgi:hypothetical protein